MCRRKGLHCRAWHARTVSTPCATSSLPTRSLQASPDRCAAYPVGETPILQAWDFQDSSPRQALVGGKGVLPLLAPLVVGRLLHPCALLSLLTSPPFATTHSPALQPLQHADVVQRHVARARGPAHHPAHQPGACAGGGHVGSASLRPLADGADVVPPLPHTHPPPNPWRRLQGINRATNAFLQWALGAEGYQTWLLGVQEMPQARAGQGEALGRMRACC